MSDFEDEEGVDEPVLEDENDEEDQEEEVFLVSKCQLSPRLRTSHTALDWVIIFSMTRK